MVFYHFAREILNCNLPLFTEKPMAANSIQADKLFKISNNNNLTYMVGNMRVHDEGVINSKIELDNILLKNNLGYDLDFYNSNYETGNYENTFRFFPSASMTTSYPMTKFEDQKSILFEPITQIIYTHDNNDNKKIINQDSLEVELMSSNLGI